MGIVGKLLGVDLSKILDDKAERLVAWGLFVFLCCCGAAILYLAISCR